MDPVKKSDLKQNPTFFKQKLLCKHIEQRNDRNRTEEVAHPSELLVIINGDQPTTFN